MLKFVLLMMLPLAFASLERRFILNDFVDLDLLRGIVSHLAHQYGDDPTEQQCETSCHALMVNEQSLGHTWCPAICRSFQELLHLLDVEGTTTAKP